MDGLIHGWVRIWMTSRPLGAQASTSGPLMVRFFENGAFCFENNIIFLKNKAFFFGDYFQQQKLQNDLERKEKKICFLLN